jgi:hypothetical protein
MKPRIYSAVVREIPVEKHRLCRSAYKVWFSFLPKIFFDTLHFLLPTCQQPSSLIKYITAINPVALPKIDRNVYCIKEKNASGALVRIIPCRYLHIKKTMLLSPLLGHTQTVPSYNSHHTTNLFSYANHLPFNYLLKGTGNTNALSCMMFKRIGVHSSAQFLQTNGLPT